MSDLTTKVLIEIRDEMKATRGEMKGMREEMGGMREEMGGMREDMGGMREDMKGVQLILVRHEQALAKLVVGVDSLNRRFDNFLTGAHKEAHDEGQSRLDDLEMRVTRLEGRATRGRHRAG